MNKPFTEYLKSIRPEDEKDINYCYQYIISYIERKKPIPYSMVSVFIQMLQHAHSINYSKSANEAENICNQIVRGYKKELKSKSNEELFQIKSSLKFLLLELIIQLYNFKIKNIGIKKESVISFIYHNTENCYEILIPIVKKENKLKYIRKIISGRITHSLFEPLSKSVDPTNEQIFQATRNTFKKNRE